ncbi:MAG: [protein-PII] uridylyltransferase [Thermodesulfovibrionales bacterium]|nr:[protein-PII] uridylyltransferase [Thermodesulfovibrionales bacterium]
MTIKEKLNNLLENKKIFKKRGFTISQLFTEIVDKEIQEIYHKICISISPNIDEKTNLKGIVVIALGGYGRKELTCYSDIDLMILVEKREAYSEEMAKALLYELWDTGLNISHSFRTLEECLEDAMRDITIRTALLESRYIAGDINLYDQYKTDIYQKILHRDKKSFISKIILEAYKRHKKAGDSTYLLEPNIKEGKGALRDIHTIQWLAKTFFRINETAELSRILSKKDFTHFLKAYDFLLKLRLTLHFISKRRNDNLSYEFQMAVAKILSIHETNKYSSVEILMRLYYKKASQITAILQKVEYLCTVPYLKNPPSYAIKKISKNFFLFKNEIFAKDKQVLKKIENILEVFYLLSKTGKKLSYQLKDQISNYIVKVKKHDISANTIKYLVNILKSNRVYETLNQMHELTVLDRILPEFGKLRHLVIYEPYHKYTVDEHTLLSIRNLEELSTTKEERLKYLKDIFQSTKQEILYLALLLHDIGKGVNPFIAKKHEEKSYIIIKGIIERFNLPSKDIRKIEFLVRNHIILSKLALTRDIDAPETVTHLSEIVESEENLNYLFLMTYADMTAVSPTYWTQWKSYLFSELMIKTKKHLTGSLPQNTQIYEPEIKTFLENMPYRYCISHTLEEIKEDFNLLKSINKDNHTIIKIKERSDHTAEIIISTFDIIGLFAKIVKILKLKGLNIIRARLYTSKRGIVLDKIIISNWKDLWWEGFEEELKEALRKEIEKNEFISYYPSNLTYEKSLLLKKSIAFKRFEYFIEIDNEASSEFTILEISAPDRIGLLYDISMNLYLNEIDIASAIINTEDEIAQDVFYIQQKCSKLSSHLIFKVINSIYHIIY